MVTLRRRAMFLFVGCLVLLGLGLWMYQDEQERQMLALGDAVEVVVAARELAPWTSITEKDLTTRKIPKAFITEGATVDLGETVGKSLMAQLPKGAMVPEYLLTTDVELQPGERTWEMRHDKNVTIDSAIQPGDQVDILAAVSRDGEDGVETVLTGARVVSVQKAEKDYAITLAVTIDQGRVLMEVENFARQVRVVRDPFNSLAAKGGRS